MAISIVLTGLAGLLPSNVLANSGPTYWQGYPASEVMLVKENSPIIVKNEDLTFDFSDYEGRSYTIDGKVTATYHMVNSTDQAQSVQMAFPVVAELASFKASDVEITADGSSLPYEIYIGDVVENYRNNSEENKKKAFDFENIVGTISDKYYQAENFEIDEKGKLYTINVKPTTEQRVNFVVDFRFDYNKTKVFTKGFNRYERSSDKVRIAAWCYEPETLEVYVLGEDIDIKISAFSDGELKEKTDLFTHHIASQEMEVKSYLMKMATEDNDMGSNENEMASVKQQNTKILSEVQLYNMYAKTLDKYLEQGMGFSSDSVLTDQWRLRRIIAFVYTVEFPENSEKEVTVNYNITGTMDMRKTSKPLYYFDYILNPAKKWSDFKNLNIKIITPKEAPYIVESSIQLEKTSDNTYVAFLESLPEDDLFFTLYSNEKVSKIDKSLGKVWRNLRYFAPLLMGFGKIFTIIIVAILTVAVIRKRRK
ncbi:MAG TPA: hypothetical protein GXX20_03280 [Clostridiaceae bacterium]|nr:hypothetical protein [Clostridiaceae bacterium]